MSLQAEKHQLGETRPHAAPGCPLLEAKDIRRTFGETIALDSCSLSVAPGEIHAVVGENGSGKSTLIKILSGIVSAESGTLEWNGQPFQVSSPRAAQAAGIATVFQETLILPEMSVRDNVMLGLDGVVRRAKPIRRGKPNSYANRSQPWAWAASISRNSRALCRSPVVSLSVSRALFCGRGVCSFSLSRHPQSISRIA